MKPSIAAWLAQLGFERYSDAFVAADIELDVLTDLNETDLEKLGVTLGDRKRMLRTIAGGLRETAPPAVPNEAAGERRQLTVLFCDLVGSTALAARLDPEDMRAVIVAYHGRCAEVVGAHGGDVAQYLGDGVMVQFGFPRAYEDDAERAVRCALALTAAVADLSFADGLRLQTRVGISTGTEVVGDSLGAPRDRASVTGSTPSLASRFQNLAAPNTVVIGPRTRVLIGDAFALTPLGMHDVKGASEPVELWRVDREVRWTSRFAARHVAAPSRFFGREFETGLLLDRWSHVTGGEGHAVLLVAEPGVGKSRIIEEFLERSRLDDAVVIRLQCSPHYASSSLQPLREFVERMADITFADSAADKSVKLAELSRRLPLATADAVDALALLIASPGADEPPRIRPLTTEQRKELVFGTALKQLAAIAERGSVCVVAEDLHWVDPTTLELLTRVIETIDRRRILVVAAARLEFVSPWSHHGHLTTIALDRLKRNSVEAMIVELCGGKTLPPALLQQIVERTDGVPLFVEELTKTVLESMAVEKKDDRFTLVDEVRSFAIPQTLRDALTARLDSLAWVRLVAQVGAVIGREFSRDLLAIVSGQNVATLDESLAALVASGLVLPKRTPAGPGYSFKHALVRDAAYETLLRPRRQQFHLRTAQAIVAHFAARAEAEPEIVAEHFEEGGYGAEALVYWRRAARLAISRSAYREAAAHLKRALALIEDGPSDDVATELDLRNRLGVVYLVLEGGRSETARGLYERASALAIDVPESPATFTALLGLCYCDYMSGRMKAALQKAATLVSLAERLGDPDLMLEALHASWGAAFSFGNVALTLETTARAVAIYDPGRHHVHVTKFGHGHDSGICGLGHGAMALVLAGRIDEARRWIAHAQTLSERLQHPFSTCVGLDHIAFSRELLGEHDTAISAVNDCLSIAGPRNFATPFAICSLVGGAARIGRGDRAAGIGLLLQTLDGTVTAPAPWRPFFEARLALEQLAAGSPEEADARVSSAEASVIELGGAVAASEVSRARATLLLAKGEPKALVARFIEFAAERAREDGSVLLELRAAMDGLKLFSDMGDVAAIEAARLTVRTLLARIEGGDEALDVRNAKALLEAGATSADAHANVK